MYKQFIAIMHDENLNEVEAVWRVMVGSGMMGCGMKGEGCGMRDEGGGSRVRDAI